jgi:hypothetical protein
MKPIYIEPFLPSELLDEIEAHNTELERIANA